VLVEELKAYLKSQKIIRAQQSISPAMAFGPPPAVLRTKILRFARNDTLAE